MSPMLATLLFAFRKYVVDGLPASGVANPSKDDIAAFGRQLELALAAAGGNLIRFETVSEMEADTTRDEGQLAHVYLNNGSADDPANGAYQWADGDWIAAPWYFDAVAAVVQPLVDEAEGYADDAEAAVVAAEAARDAAALYGATLDLTYDPRSGFLLGLGSLNGRRLLGFRITDGRPIFAKGGDIAARLDTLDAQVYAALNGAISVVEEDRSGWAVAARSPDGRVLWGIDRIKSRLWTARGVSITDTLTGATARLAALEAEVFTATSLDLVVVGDSMSQPASPYVNGLASLLPARTQYNLGMPGAKTKTLAIAFGVPDILTLTPTGGVLPISGTVACAYSDHFLNASQCARVEVPDELGRAVVCWLARDAGAGYTIRPATYPAAPIRLQSPARARVISLQVAGADPSAAQALDPLYDKVLSLRVARNDTPYDKGYDGPAIISYAQRMTGLMRSGRFVVVGPTNGKGDVPVAQGGVNAVATQVQAQQTLENNKDANSRMLAAFPRNFASAMAAFQAAGNTIDLTVNGATYAVSNDTVLVSDGVHETAPGGLISAGAAKDKLIANGD